MKEKVLEIVRQLAEDPNSLPLVYLPPDPSISTSSSGNSAAAGGQGQGQPSAEEKRETPEPPSGNISDGESQQQQQQQPQQHEQQDESLEVLKQKLENVMPSHEGENSASHSEQSTMHQQSVRSLPASEPPPTPANLTAPVDQHSVHSVEEVVAMEQRKKDDKSFADLELNLQSIMGVGKSHIKAAATSDLPSTPSNNNNSNSNSNVPSSEVPPTSPPAEPQKSSRFCVSPVVVPEEPPPVVEPPLSPKGRFTVQRAPDSSAAVVVTADSTPSPGGESSNYTTASESVAGVAEKGLEPPSSVPQVATTSVPPQQEISVSFYYIIRSFFCTVKS